MVDRVRVMDSTYSTHSTHSTHYIHLSTIYPGPCATAPRSAVAAVGACSAASVAASASEGRRSTTYPLSLPFSEAADAHAKLSVTERHMH